jgi:hypothetical protein
LPGKIHHNGFGALDLHTLSLLLDLFDVVRLIQHGFFWSQKLRCGRIANQRLKSHRHQTRFAD